MEERRRIDRVGYQAKSVIVVCDTGESIFVETRNVSPLGIAFTMPAGSPDLKGNHFLSTVLSTAHKYGKYLLLPSAPSHKSFHHKLRHRNK